LNILQALQIYNMMREREQEEHIMKIHMSHYASVVSTYQQTTFY